MEATVQDFPNFLEGVTSEEAQDLLPEIAEMKSAWDEEDGLVPAAALGELFGISKQAAYQLPVRYGLSEWTFFNKKWHSMREVKALHKLKRNTGAGGHKMAQMVRDCLDDAREN